MDTTAHHPAECDCEETTIVVEPVPGGWRLRCDGCGEPLMFLSGATAEAQAHALAKRLADCGQTVRIQVRGHDDGVAASDRREAGHA